MTNPSLGEFRPEDLRGMVFGLPSRYDDGHYDSCAIRIGEECDCPYSEYGDD